MCLATVRTVMGADDVRTVGEISDESDSASAEDRHRRDASLADECTAGVLGETNSGVLNLSIAGLSAELPDEFADLGDPGRPDRMPSRLESTTRINRYSTVEKHVPVTNERRSLTGTRRPSPRSASVLR